jgi:hypothetical protein
LGLFKLSLPEPLLRVVCLLLTAVLLWRYSLQIPKILLVAGCVVLASVLVGIL